MKEQMINEKYLNFSFQNTNGVVIKMRMKSDIKIKELLDNYVAKAYSFLGPKELVFLYNGEQIDRYDQRKVEDYFKPGDSFSISVRET